jgi:hypothetical protein
MLNHKIDLDIAMINIDDILNGLFTKMTAKYAEVESAKREFGVALLAANKYEDDLSDEHNAYPEITNKYNDDDIDDDRCDKNYFEKMAIRHRLWDVVVEKNHVIATKMAGLHAIKNESVSCFTECVVNEAIRVYNENPVTVYDDLATLNSRRRAQNETYDDALKSKNEADCAFDYAFKQTCLTNEDDDDHKKKKKNHHKKLHNKCRRGHGSDSDSSDSDDDSSSDDESSDDERGKSNDCSRNYDYQPPVLPAIPPARKTFSGLIMKLIIDTMTK